MTDEHFAKQKQQIQIYFNCTAAQAAMIAKGLRGGDPVLQGSAGAESRRCDYQLPHRPGVRGA